LYTDTVLTGELYNDGTLNVNSADTNKKRVYKYLKAENIDTVINKYNKIDPGLHNDGKFNTYSIENKQANNDTSVIYRMPLLAENKKHYHDGKFKTVFLYDN